MSALLEQLLTPEQRAEAAKADAQIKRAPAWISMTPAERTTTLTAMAALGGDFVRALAVCWRRADTMNSIRLGAVMGDYVRHYGPGSTLYAMVERRSS